MERNVTQLNNKVYDILVIGGGIYGASIARDAALRGLSVCLIERGDFGHATSANSLKTIHGGLRYLQDGDLKLVRMMMHERMSMMRIAPHLVHPLPCLMLTYAKLTRSKLIMRAALAANDLLGLSYNRLPDPQKRLPYGQVISRDACLQIAPGIDATNVTGGAVWHDAQVINSERMTLALIQSAAEGGANVANYVQATALLTSENRVIGVDAEDMLSGGRFKLHANLVINAAGAWINHIDSALDVGALVPEIRQSIAINLVTRQLIPEYAVGVPTRPELVADGGQKKPQMLFISPWQQYSIIGTYHLPTDKSPDCYKLSETDVDDFIAQINTAYPGAALKRSDVRFIHWGFLPAVDSPDNPDQVSLVRRGKVIDHQQQADIDGLISVVGVKYTSARYVAQQAVDLVFQKLGRVSPACRTHVTPVFGGDIPQFGPFVESAKRKASHSLHIDLLQHLIYNYGTAYALLLPYIDEDPCWGEPVSPNQETIKAEIVHAVHYEMACKLSDVVFRRTSLGSAGRLETNAIETCATIMAAEFGWQPARIAQEIANVELTFAQKT